MLLFREGVKTVPPLLGGGGQRRGPGCSSPVASARQPGSIHPREAMLCSEGRL